MIRRIYGLGVEHKLRVCEDIFMALSDGLIDYLVAVFKAQDLHALFEEGYDASLFLIVEEEELV